MWREKVQWGAKAQWGHWLDDVGYLEDHAFSGAGACGNFLVMNECIMYARWRRERRTMGRKRNRGKRTMKWKWNARRARRIREGTRLGGGREVGE